MSRTRSKARQLAVSTSEEGNYVPLPQPRPTATSASTSSSGFENKRKFEELFHDPLCQKTAFDMLNSFLDDKAKKIGIPTRTTRATAVDFESKSACKPPSPSTDDGRVEVNQEGAAMVNDLLGRYDNARKERMKRKQKFAKEITESDEELDFVLSDDDSDGGVGKDNFVKLCVQDYDLKVRLYKAHCNVIRSMSGSAVEDLGRTVLPELDEIMEETVQNERHNVFKKCGLSKSKLREMTVSEPFNDKQEHHVMKLIENKLSTRYNLTDNNGQILHYISNVLVPEALVRIYAKANQIGLELAEKELRYGGRYDGAVPTELLQDIQLQS